MSYNPNTIYPIAGYDKEIYVKPTIKNPNIIVGEFTYMADSDFGFYTDRHLTFRFIVLTKVFCLVVIQMIRGMIFSMRSSSISVKTMTTRMPRMK